MLRDPQFPGDLVTFTEEIFNGKLHLLHTEVLIRQQVRFYCWCGSQWLI